MFIYSIISKASKYTKQKPMEQQEETNQRLHSGFQSPSPSYRTSRENVRKAVEAGPTLTTTRTAVGCDAPKPTTHSFQGHLSR